MISAAKTASKGAEGSLSAYAAKTAPAANVICPAYALTFPPGQSAFTAYPYLLHNKQTLPWSVILAGGNMRLRSNNCAKISPSLDAKNASACINCSLLHNHNIVMGIRHRALDGAHQNTPWHYLGPEQMYKALGQKTKTMNYLKLKALNGRRTLAIRNRHISTWKRLAIAVGRDDIPRLRTLVATELRRGSSVFAIVEKIEKAARRAYSPQGYQEADYKLAFLFLKMGGRTIANLASRAFGLPSIDTTKRHISVNPLKSSPGFPTSTELNSNLAACYPSEELGSSCKWHYPWCSDAR